MPDINQTNLLRLSLSSEVSACMKGSDRTAYNKTPTSLLNLGQLYILRARQESWIVFFHSEPRKTEVERKIKLTWGKL